MEAGDVGAAVKKAEEPQEEDEVGAPGEGCDVGADEFREGEEGCALGEAQDVGEMEGLEEDEQERAGEEEEAGGFLRREGHKNSRVVEVLKGCSGDAIAGFSQLRGLDGVWGRFYSAGTGVGDRGAREF